jgi:hypothetical protein
MNNRYKVASVLSSVNSSAQSSVNYLVQSSVNSKDRNFGNLPDRATDLENREKIQLSILSSQILIFDNGNVPSHIEQTLAGTACRRCRQISLGQISKQWEARLILLPHSFKRTFFLANAAGSGTLSLEPIFHTGWLNFGLSFGGIFT